MMFRNMSNFIAVVFLLSGVSSLRAARECSSKSIAECFNGTQTSLFDLLSSQNADQYQHCQFMETNGRCMKEVAEACQRQQKISEEILALHDYLKHLCDENEKLFTVTAPCLKENELAFKECDSDRKTVDHFLNLCNSGREVQCKAELGRKLCNNGPAFAQALHAKVEKLQSEVCFPGSGKSTPGSVRGRRYADHNGGSVPYDFGVSVPYDFGRITPHFSGGSTPYDYGRSSPYYYGGSTPDYHRGGTSDYSGGSTPDYEVSTPDAIVSTPDSGVTRPGYSYGILVLVVFVSFACGNKF